MFDKVKLALRLIGPAFDDEIEGLIAAAKADLRLTGIVLPEDKKPFRRKDPPPKDDPLITRAIILYCKGNFGYIKDGEKFIEAYNHLKCSLSLAGDYNAVE